MDFKIEKFSYRLSVLLEENNLSQTKLAQYIGTSNVTICRYLNGERIPRLDVVAKIADVFNVSIDYLLGISDNKKFKETNEDSDIDIALLIKNIYSLEGNFHLSKKQIDLIKKILLANKDFVLSA